MPAVMTFWWLPDEENSFLDFLDGTGEVLALPFKGSSRREDLLGRPFRDFILTENPQQLFLCLAIHLPEVQIESSELVEDGKTVTRFRVVDMKSCVIGYDRGTLIGHNKLAASNLYAYWNYPNTSGQSMIKKPQEFINWAKKVYQWVYRVTPEWHQYKNYRVTNRVKKAIHDKGLQIASY